MNAIVFENICYEKSIIVRLYYEYRNFYILEQVIKKKAFPLFVSMNRHAFFGSYWLGVSIYNINYVNELLSENIFLKSINKYIRKEC